MDSQIGLILEPVGYANPTQNNMDRKVDEGYLLLSKNNGALYCYKKNWGQAKQQMSTTVFKAFSTVPDHGSNHPRLFALINEINFLEKNVDADQSENTRGESRVD